MPIRDSSFTSDLHLICFFDVNIPRAEVDDLKGGVAGGSIVTCVLHLGQEVEIRLGIVTKDNAGRNRCKPIIGKIVSLLAESNHLSFAAPGGLIDVGTKIDPTFCCADRLVGQVSGAVGKLPKVYTGTTLLFFPAPSRTPSTSPLRTRNQPPLSPPTPRRPDGRQELNRGVQAEQGELLLINIGSTSTGGRVLSVKGDLVPRSEEGCAVTTDRETLSTRGCVLSMLEPVADPI
jgi:translation initiation factor 2 subunit 3